MSFLPRRIRYRTALLIAIALIAFLTLFFGATYFSIRGSLLARSDDEVRQQLHHVLSELERNTTTEKLPPILLKYSRTGESQLHYFVFQIQSDSMAFVYPDRNDSTISSSALRQLALHPGVPLEYYSRDTLERLLAERQGNFIVIAALNNTFLEEASQSMVEIFGYSLLIGLALAAVIGYWVSGLTVRPITILIGASRTILRTIGSTTSTRLPVSTSIDEVAELARSINELLDQRESSLERMRHFTADAAHELRTPLAVLKGEIEVELRTQQDASLYTELLRSNLEEVERLISIVQDLLFLAAVEAESDLHEQMTCSIQQTVVLACQRLSAFAEEKSIRIEIRIEDVTIGAEEERLGRLIYNVVLNAIQHSSQGSAILIGLRRESSGNIILNVQDNGTGIPAHDIPHIFDRFYRADKSRSRVHGGAGLGLPIAKSIAERYGFTLSIESMLDVGTTVHLTVPSTAIFQVK